jgi:3-isopropylmalate/(R)-2-methylmalate dehydratase small subunit
MSGNAVSGSGMGETMAGTVWVFGDHINTDLMLPGSVRHASAEVQARNVFVANRPGWVDQVRRGDFIVAGENFGTGSSRPAARSLRNCGVACVIANSINGLFFRNAVNYGLLALECRGVAAAFTEGQTAEFSLTNFNVRNRDTGVVLRALPIPKKLLDIMIGGGLLPVMEARGLIAPESAKDAAS